MGRQHNQSPKAIRTGVNSFSSQIKRFFERSQHGSKKSHLRDLYIRYEESSRALLEREQQRSKQRVKQRHQVLELVLRRLRGEEGLQGKYLARRQKLGEYLAGKQPVEKHNDLVCPICMEFYINPVPTSCGHTFCLRCIQNALLFKSVCPVCRAPLRGQELSPSLAVNSVVKMHVQRLGDTEQLNIYEGRMQETQQWQDKRSQGLEAVVVGDRLDVRDTEYIWCVGKVLNIYLKNGKPSELLIHYLGWNRIYDQILQISSPRIAPLGLFTSREDIPRYALSQNQENYYSYVVTGPQPPPQPERRQNESEHSQMREQSSSSEEEPENNDQNTGVLLRHDGMMLSALLTRMGLENLSNHINLNNIGTAINVVELPDLNERTIINIEYRRHPREPAGTPVEVVEQQQPRQDQHQRHPNQEVQDQQHQQQHNQPQRHNERTQVEQPLNPILISVSQPSQPLAPHQPDHEAQPFLSPSHSQPPQPQQPHYE